jgi:tetratricopeptide (TPR) repeat protein
MKKYQNKFDRDANEFIDRTEIIERIRKEFQIHSGKDDYYKVFIIYGIGGMGKSRLIKELATLLKNTYSKIAILNVTFELLQQEQLIENLIQIRKAFNKPCVLFDFALLLYWDRKRIERLNDDFMQTIKMDLPAAFTDIGIDIGIGIGLSATEIALSAPLFTDLLDSINKAISKIRIKSSDKETIEIIKDMPGLKDVELLDRIASYLGMDIHRRLNKSKQKYVFIFDSYQYRQPYSLSEDWLLHLITEIEKGLFIVTGREKLPWVDDEGSENEPIIHELKSYPEEDARAFLGKLMGEENDLISTIIEITQCVPIYIDLAVNVYNQGKSISPEGIVTKSLFSDRSMLVKNFVSHLKLEWQDIIFDLSTIRVFNESIFEHIIKDLNLRCPIYDFNELCQSSLCNYIENTDGLVKIHDVFSENARAVCDKQHQIRIIRSYLNYLSKRGVNDLTDSQLVTVASNMLQVVIDADIEYHNRENRKTIFQQTDFEMIMDVILGLSNRRGGITAAIEIDPSFSEGINDLLHVIGILFGKITTTEKVDNLDEIKTPEQFGKHKKSLQVLKAYQGSLTGEYAQLKIILEDLNSQFLSSEQLEWYYSKTKIYLSDYWLIIGMFKESYKMLIEYEDQMPGLIPIDDFFLAERSIGHIYRFNMELDAAETKYKELLSKYEGIISIRAYQLMNLCETFCYFQPDKFNDCYIEAKSLSTQLSQNKNLGKLLYSKALSEIRLKHYDQALSNIEQCVEINEREGYQSGKLFGFMAKAYYDYGKYGQVSDDTARKIDHLLKKNGVYTFFNLQLSILNKDYAATNALKNKYSWLNFDKTCEMYKKYIGQFRPL